MSAESIASPAPTLQDARLESRLHIAHVRGQSRATTCESRQPLRILTPAAFTSCCCAVVTHFGGGFVQGDKVALKVTCDDGARLYLTTQSNTRVYKAEDARMATQELSGHLTGDSLAVIFADPLAPHKDSRFSQQQTWHLEDASTLILWDWLSSGRSESGECFAFDELHSCVRIHREQKLLISDRFAVIPKDHHPSSAGRFSHFNSHVNLYLIGKRATAIGVRLREMLKNTEIPAQRYHLSDQAPAPDAPPPRVLYSINQIADDATLVRALGVRRSDLDTLARDLSRMLESQNLLGCDPLSRRW